MMHANRNVIETDNFNLVIMENDEDFRSTKDFDCGNEDLNEFFQKDALNHKKVLLAKTYYLESRKATDEGILFPVAFVSFLNDIISITKEEKKTKKKKFWKDLKKILHYHKRKYSSFPAVKIARLGVKKEYQRQNIGTALLNMTKDLFLTDNRTGCRFITVDAYNKEYTISFYKKNGFRFLTEEDAEKDTRIMYFDLTRHN